MFGRGRTAADTRNKKAVSENIEIIPLELPGHGMRMFSDEPIPSIQKMADDIFKQIISNGVDENYCVLGYSMGSLICYEVCLKLFLGNFKMPKHIFICASDTPHHKENFKNVVNKTPDEMKDELIKLGGTPKEILENDELMDLFLPIIKNDFIAIELYEPTETDAKIPVPFTVVCGSEEFVKDNTINNWDKYFSCDGKILSVEGGHFYIHDSPKKLADILESEIYK